MRKTICGLFIVLLVGAFFLIPAASGAERTMNGSIQTTGTIFQSESGEEYYVNQSQAGNTLLMQDRGKKVKVQALVEAAEEGMWPTITIKSYEVIQE